MDVFNTICAVGAGVVVGGGAMYAAMAKIMDGYESHLKSLAAAARQLHTNVKAYADNPFINISGAHLHLQLQPDLKWVEFELALLEENNIVH